jgi:hypothetical protein
MKLMFWIDPIYWILEIKILYRIKFMPAIHRPSSYKLNVVDFVEGCSHLRYSMYNDHISYLAGMVFFCFKAEFRFPTCPIPILYVNFHFRFKAHFNDFFPIFFTITGVVFAFHYVSSNTHLQGNCLTRRFTRCCRFSKAAISTYSV